MCLGFDSGLLHMLSLRLVLTLFGGYFPGSPSSLPPSTKTSISLIPEFDHDIASAWKSVKASFLSLAISLKRKLNIFLEEFETETDAGPEYHTTNRNRGPLPYQIFPRCYRISTFKINRNFEFPIHQRMSSIVLKTLYQTLCEKCKLTFKFFVQLLTTTSVRPRNTTAAASIEQGSSWENNTQQRDLENTAAGTRVDGDVSFILYSTKEEGGR